MSNLWTAGLALPAITNNSTIFGPGVAAANGFVYAVGSQSSAETQGFAEVYAPPFQTYIYVKN